MNAVGMFIEESDLRDYKGLLSFLAATYIVVPFQAYAAIKGLLEREEGHWFRTPKTGLITIEVMRGHFRRLFGWLFPRHAGEKVRRRLATAGTLRFSGNPQSALATANNRFDNFGIKRRQIRGIGRVLMTLLLIVSTNIVYFSYFIPINPTSTQAPPGSIIKGKRGELPSSSNNSREIKGGGILDLVAPPAFAAEALGNEIDTVVPTRNFSATFQSVVESFKTLVLKVMSLFSPQILDAFVHPKKVKAGDMMVVQVRAKDLLGVRTIAADMGGIEKIKLELVEGTRFVGTWREIWLVHNTETKKYETVVTVTNVVGRTATTSVFWSDPVYTWDGSDSTDWFTGANWDQTTVPGDTDDVVINGGYTYAPTINVADTIGSLAIGQNNASVLTFSNNITLTVGGNVTVYANGTITHTANSTTETHKLTISAANIDIQASGKIDVSGRGYTEGYGGSGGSAGRAGGSYGGNGGDYSGSSGNTYGSYTQPTNIGSGGGTNQIGGNGGGAIKLNVTGTLTVSGSILADGTVGSACDTGGGAGGSIWIVTDTITGGGTTSAKGGNAGQQSGCHSAGGGGGRIAIEYASGNYSFTGTLTAYSGLKMGGGEYGGAGTIYKESSTQSNGGGDLIIDNNNYDNYYDTAEIEAGTYQFDSITLDKKGHLVFKSSTTLTLTGDETGDGTYSELVVLGGTLNFPSSYTLNGYSLCLHNSTTNSGLTTLIIGSTGMLTHYPNGTTETHKINLTLTGGLTINSGGKINIDARGYQKNYGGSGGSSGRSGGSYGGNGGDYVGSSGNTYGSYSQPTNIGGGSGGGPSGAGAVKIDASGVTIDVSGTISANGGVGGVDQGGGAGGSIWLIANAITGNGSITANGGTTSYNAAGGGGGRIAIEYTAGNYSFTGTLTAYGAAMGGTGENGGAGTIYKKSSTQTYGDLIVDNNNLSTDTFDIAEIEAGTYQFDSVTLNKKGHLKFKATSSVNIGASSISGDGTDAELTVLGTATFSSSYTIDGWVWSVDNTTTVSGLTALTISSDGGVTHTQNFTTETHKINLTLTGGLIINQGGKISVNGKGYQPGYGGNGGSSGRAGGSYGGNGGDYSGTSGGTYGSYSQPTNIGGGGGGGSTYGGGVIKIDASGATINVSGTISANGTSGGLDTGAGAGGSIWLIADTITGSTGSITANGSNAINVNAAGGGGGRIAIEYTAGNYNFTGTLTAYGGAGTGSGASESGGAGTIYKKSSTQTGGDLIIINNNLTTTGDTAEIESGTYTLDSMALDDKGDLTFKATTSLTMNSGATFSGDSTAQLTLNGSLSLPSSFTFTGFDTAMTGSISGSTSAISVNDLVEFNGTATSGFSSFSINSGGILRHTANSTTETYKMNIVVSSSFTINSGGSIALTGRGYTEDNGLGKGSGSSGGGHGGAGGNGNSGSGGGTYDVPATPANLGSGAGPTNNGGSGGGYVKINATGGTITINTGGEIRVDGSNGSTDAAGGGAGGSIYLITSTLDGCGTLSAKGGNGTTNGGGGGGGLIAYYSDTDNFTSCGTTDVSGGTGLNAGGNGTVTYSSTLYIWDGSSSTDWFTGANWNQDAVPGDNDDVVIDGNYTNAPTINAADTIGSLAIGQNNTSVLTFSNNITLTVGGNVTVYANGTITHTANSSSETHKLTISAANIDIQASGKIDASEKGYNAQTGPGYSSQYCSSYGPGSGASYGGWGGCNTTNGPYGSESAPINIGSGGRGGYVGEAGGKGGGVIKLDVTGTLTISGTISAEGQDRPGGGNGGGGGSGGSIWIIAGSLAGTTGTITANGGDSPAGGGGGGGGGRITITGYSSDNFTGTKSAYGGSEGGTRDGGAGTIYTKSSSQTNGDLLIKNNNLGGPDLNTLTSSSYTFDGVTVQDTGKAKTGATTTLTTTTLTVQTSGVFTSQYTSTATTLTGDASGSVVTASGGSVTISNTTLSNPPVTNNGTFTANGASFTLQTTFIQNGTVNFPSSDLTIGNGGTLEIKNTNLTLNNLTIQSGGILTHTDNSTTETYKIVLTINQDMNINAGGKVDVDQRGYDRHNGTGFSSQYCSSYGPGSGASYGGWGGCNTTNGPYGSESAPINIGSGGRDGYVGSVGGNGGGAVRIDVTGTLTISGEITADGQSAGGTGNTGGGGSGGSVYLNVGALDGCGTISTTGGNSPSGGGGGGGRIAYYYTADNFSSCGTVTAAGGTGQQAGGSGTIIPENLWFLLVLAPFLPQVLRRRFSLVRI